MDRPRANPSCAEEAHTDAEPSASFGWPDAELVIAYPLEEEARAMTSRFILGLIDHGWRGAPFLDRDAYVFRRARLTAMSPTMEDER